MESREYLETHHEDIKKMVAHCFRRSFNYSIYGDELNDATQHVLIDFLRQDRLSEYDSNIGSLSGYVYRHVFYAVHKYAKYDLKYKEPLDLLNEDTVELNKDKDKLFENKDLKDLLNEIYSDSLPKYKTAMQMMLCGLTASDAARATGISPQAICEWRKAKKKKFFDKYQKMRLY